MKPGERINLYNLIVERRSAYTKSIYHPGGEEHVITVWRFALRSRDNPNMRFVYSGKCLGVQLKPGDRINLRATVKYWDGKFNQWRLTRAKVVEPVEWQGRLL